MVYIRFVADGGFISRGIGFRTLGKPSHVEYLTTDDAGKPVSTFGARFRGGIIYRPYRMAKFEEWYTFTGVKASYAEALKLEGRRYDASDIFHLLFGFHPAYYDPQRLICSTLVAYSNRMAWAAGAAPNLINPNLETWRITPEILYGAVTSIVKKVA